MTSKVKIALELLLESYETKIPLEYCPLCNAQFRRNCFTCDWDKYFPKLVNELNSTCQTWLSLMTQGRTTEFRSLFHCDFDDIRLRRIEMLKEWIEQARLAELADAPDLGSGT